ncbi:MAG: hypothetical protein CMQ11_16470, partial [Gammaproteobacteria bacterium]|nr:hypothetical protein [Gammaproteobacteria bacterium]
VWANPANVTKQTSNSNERRAIIPQFLSIFFTTYQVNITVFSMLMLIVLNFRNKQRGCRRHKIDNNTG